jgi:hypothetical protein
MVKHSAARDLTAEPMQSAHRLGDTFRICSQALNQILARPQ